MVDFGEEGGFLDFSLMTKVYRSYLLRCLVLYNLAVLEQHVRFQVFRKHSNIYTGPLMD